jgi:hypothetical protein
MPSLVATTEDRPIPAPPIATQTGFFTGYWLRRVWLGVTP